MKKTVKVQGKSELTAKGIHTNGNTKPVFCITTGEVFTSVHDAARATGIAQSSLSYSLQDPARTCKGKKFCFVTDMAEHLEEMAECIRKANEYDKIVAKKNAIKNAEENVKNTEENVAKYRAKLEKLRAQFEKATAEHDNAVRQLSMLTKANANCTA